MTEFPDAYDLPSLSELTYWALGVAAVIVISKLISKIDILSFFSKIVLRWMPQDLIDN